MYFNSWPKIIPEIKKKIQIQLIYTISDDFCRSHNISYIFSAT